MLSVRPADILSAAARRVSNPLGTQAESLCSVRRSHRDTWERSKGRPAAIRQSGSDLNAHDDAIDSAEGAQIGRASCRERV